MVVTEYLPQAIASRSSDRKTLTIFDQQLFQDGLELYRNEAQRIEDLNSPYVAPLIDIFEENKTTYRVHEYLNGILLNNFLLGNRLPERKAIEIIAPLMKVLQAAHGIDLLHGRLSPNSIILQKEKPFLFWVS